MRGPTQGVRTSAWSEYKTTNPPIVAFSCYQSWTEDGPSLWPIVRPVTHSYSGTTLKSPRDFKKVGTKLSDLLQMTCMCAFACVYTILNENRTKRAGKNCTVHVAESSHHIMRDQISFASCTPYNFW